jgi:selenide,water dikinase
MATLNRAAAEAMAQHPVHACTDVTGFGLLGHLAEMVVGSGVGAEVDSQALPIIPQALEYAAMGLIPAGAYKNREFRENIVTIEPSVNRGVRDVLFDPQTSGGLLICTPADRVDALMGDLHKNGATGSAVIGRILSGPDEQIHVI